jgi:hypothetical protein
MERLRSIPVSFTLKFLQDYDDDHEKIFFHNVQSFLAHRADVFSDQCALASSCLAFVEPHLLKSDKIHLPTFVQFREDCRTNRNSEGALVLFKNNINASDFPGVYTDFSENGHCLIVKWRMSNVIIIMCYKSPRYTKNLFLGRLDEVLGGIIGNILVFGDFNIDLQKEEGRQVINLFRKYYMKSKLDIRASSTDGGSHIDCCFSNVQSLDAWFYECYYSYHKPICMVWKKN